MLEFLSNSKGLIGFLLFFFTYTKYFTLILEKTELFQENLSET